MAGVFALFVPRVAVSANAQRKVTLSFSNISKKWYLFIVASFSISTIMVLLVVVLLYGGSMLGVSQVGSQRLEKQEHREAMSQATMDTSYPTAMTNDTAWIETLPGVNLRDTWLLKGAIVPYQSTIDSAITMINDGEYDEAILALTTLTENPPNGVRPELAHRLLMKARTIKMWKALPKSIREDMLREMGDGSDREHRLAYLGDAIRSVGDLDKAITAAQLLAEERCDEAYEILLDTRALIGRHENREQFKTLIDSIDTLWMGNEDCVAYLVKKIERPDVLQMDDRLRNDTATFWGLARTGSPRAVEALLKMAASPDYGESARLQAIECVGFSFAEGSLDSLARFITEGIHLGMDEQLLSQAALSLSYAADRKTVQAAADLLPKTAAGSKLRGEILVSLYTTVRVHGDYFATHGSEYESARSLLERYRSDYPINHPQ